MIRSWKTTIMGCLLIIAALIMYLHDSVHWQSAVTPLLAGILGLVSKDHDITGRKFK